MRNFHFPEHKIFDSDFLDMMNMGLMKNVHLPHLNEQDFGLLSGKTFDSKFLHIFRVEFMKNFLLADSSELMAVRRNQTFLGSGGRNESHSHQLAPIGEKKIFHERDAEHV